MTIVAPLPAGQIQISEDCSAPPPPDKSGLVYVDGSSITLTCRHCGKRNQFTRNLIAWFLNSMYSEWAASDERRSKALRERYELRKQLTLARQLENEETVERARKKSVAIGKQVRELRRFASSVNRLKLSLDRVVSASKSLPKKKDEKNS